MTQAEPSAEHPLVGQTIASKYRIIRLLGEGGMGCVYQAEQMLGTTARKVAVKTLHKHLSHDESIKARFKREVGTVASLEHPNTIQIYDFGEMPDGTLYIVMEFVQGRSVADILEKDGPMPPERVENIMRQVVGSLEEAHGHGIVHRDLKPDNVVLAERAGTKDWVEVLDFGIAKRSSEHDPNEAKLTQQGMVLGTPPYMSPEQFTGQPVDVRSDIYALGVMCYEMLTGRLPWVANTAWEWASKHMTEMPTPLERQPLGANVPERQRIAITRALAKNKDERYPTVRSFFDAFSAGGAPVPVVGGPSAGVAHGGGQGTAMINGGASIGPVSSGSPPRAKTEMGAPVMDSGANAMMMGGGGGMPVSNPYGGGAPAVVPPGPMHTAADRKSGPPMLIIALGGLALLLFLGMGIAYLVSGKKKTTTTAAFDPGTATATASAASSVTAAETPTAPIETAAPLDTSATKVPVAPTGGGGGTKPTATASAKPVPTPTPVKADPPICKRAREARAMKGMSPLTIQNLEGQCRAAGGTP